MSDLVYTLSKYLSLKIYLSIYFHSLGLKVLCTKVVVKINKIRENKVKVTGSKYLIKVERFLPNISDIALIVRFNIAKNDLGRL